MYIYHISGAYCVEAEVKKENNLGMFHLRIYGGKSHLITTFMSYFHIKNKTLENTIIL